MNCHKRWPLRHLSRALSRAHSSSTTAAPAPEATTSFPLKHVTKSNFDASLADLCAHVRAADFVAIDLEMTGVTSAPWRESLEYDRFDVQYLKVKDSAEKFAVIQLGVCPFRWDSLKESFVAHPHNFFVFPSQELSLDGRSHEFLCQTASMDFLAKYQFDFNACIYKGISYLSRRQEEAALKHLNSRYEDEELESWHSYQECRDMPLNRMADVLFTERMKNTLSEWRHELLQGSKGGSQFGGSERLKTIFFKMRPALSLKGFTSHQLRLIRLVTMKLFSDLSYVRVSGESLSEQELVVYTESDGDKDLLMKEVKDECKKGEELKIKDAVGLRYVIDLLSSEQKLIVGHNCFLDIAHICSKFLGPLPSTAEEFVSSVNSCFPHIIDTKLLMNANNVLQRRMKKSSTSLSSAFALLCPQMALGSKTSSLFFEQSVKVDVQVDDIRSSEWSAGAKHEAGYDAFMTGCIFAQACNRIGIDFKLLSPSLNLAHNENLNKYVNLLYLSWINSDIIDLTTGDRSAENQHLTTNPKRFRPIKFENIVLIWGFQSRLKAREIRECISKALGPKSVISVYHVDETAVFVQFSKMEIVSEFLTMKDDVETSRSPISVLHPLWKLLEGGKTCASGYETYKEICSSPISKVLFADQAESVGIKWKTKMVEKTVGNDIESAQEDLHIAKTDRVNENIFSDDDIDYFLSETEAKQSSTC